MIWMIGGIITAQIVIAGYALYIAGKLKAEEQNTARLEGIVRELKQQNEDLLKRLNPKRVRAKHH